MRGLDLEKEEENRDDMEHVAAETEDIHLGSLQVEPKGNAAETMCLSAASGLRNAARLSDDLGERRRMDTLSVGESKSKVVRTITITVNCVIAALCSSLFPMKQAQHSLMVTCNQ